MKHESKFKENVILIEKIFQFVWHDSLVMKVTQQQDAHDGKVFIKIWLKTTLNPMGSECQIFTNKTCLKFFHTKFASLACCCHSFVKNSEDVTCWLW